MTTRPSLLNYQLAQEVAVVTTNHPKPSIKAKANKQVTEEVIQTSFRMPRSKWKKLQELSIDERKSVQSLIMDALAGEFSKRGLKF